MDVYSGVAEREQAVIELFAATFADSEGEEEGARIGGLVRDLLADTPPADIRVFRAEDRGRLIGAAIFTRLTFGEDPRLVALLSPLAVATALQRQGVGQALLDHALEALRSEGFEVAITYGDPAFYGKTGFEPISEERARAPLTLSHPHGWLGRSLTGGPMPDLKGASTCVPALNRPDVW